MQSATTLQASPPPPPFTMKAHSVLILSALSVVSAVEWDLASYLRDTRGYTAHDLRDDFRVIPNRVFGITGRSCTTDEENLKLHPPSESCGTMTVDISVSAPEILHRRSDQALQDNLELVVAMYTRSVESDLQEALHADKSGDTFCRGYKRRPEGGLMWDAPIVQAAIDQGKLVFLNASFDVTMHDTERIFKSSILETVAIPHTDLWICNVAICDVNPDELVPNSLPVDATVHTATITLIADTGHLDVRNYQLLVFHVFNFFVLAVVTLVWMVYGAMKRSAFGGVHVALTVMVVLTTLDQLFRFLLYKQWNDTGDIRSFELYFVILFETFRKVAWCFLLCILVNGYRSIHPTLAESNIKLIVLITGIYLVINCLSILNDPREEETKQSGFIEAGQNAADLLIYVYVFTVLYKMIQLLEQQSQHTKKLLFVKLYNVLTYYIFEMLAVLVLLILVFSQLNRTGRESLWRWIWVVYAIFPVLFEAALLTLMWHWRPSDVSVQLLYAIELPGDDDDGDDNDDIGEVPAVCSPFFFAFFTTIFPPLSTHRTTARDLRPPQSARSGYVPRS